MEYRQHQLENGLTIVAEVNPRAYVSAFGFFVRTGSRDETAEVNGVSHFLEHMVFKGTPNQTAEQVNLRLDEMGSASNARTSEESTIYHAAVLPEFQSELVELLSDLMRPSLRKDDFDTEKKVIIEEIQMYRDQPPYGGHEKVMAEFFGEHPLGQSVLGTEESVSALSPAQMKQYFQVRYSPGNMALAAAGKIDFEQLIEDANKFCGPWEPHDVDRAESQTEFQTGFKTLLKPNSHQQYILQLAPGVAANAKERYATRVMTAILGDSGGSRMYWKFLDSGLAESAGMGAYEYCDNGLFMSYLCCSPESAQENLERLHELQDSARSGGIQRNELELAKRKIASHIVLGSERTEARMFSVGSQWLAGRPYKTVAEIAEIYDSVTLDEVNEALQMYPLTENMTLCVGPNADLKIPAA